MTTIKVNINDNCISIYNDGRGIPIEIHKDSNLWMPQFIFSELLTSSNYETEKRITGGMNGLGAKLTNILST